MSLRNLAETALADGDVSKVPQLAALPTNTRMGLQNICRLHRFESEEIVAHAGERLDHICCVKRGILRMQKTLHDGRQQIVGLLVEGDLFGRVFDGPLTVAIEAATEAEVIAFRREPFEALLLDSSELERLVLRNLLNELDRARDWLIILSNPRIRGRVAGFLSILATRFATVEQLVKADGQSLSVRIPISRIDLAHLLGTRAESISRALHALAGDKIIGIHRPDLIEIRDIERLVAEAGEDGTDVQASLQGLLLAVTGPNERVPDQQRGAAVLPGKRNSREMRLPPKGK
jgi:CRP/FNR family transcriptional regulator, anaerobic regulatory protein